VQASACATEEKLVVVLAAGPVQPEHHDENGDAPEGTHDGESFEHDSFSNLLIV
jgi:hypothetical protein